MVDRCQKSQEAEDKQSRTISEKMGQVLTIQKNGVYEFRNHILDSADVTSVIKDQMSRYVDEVVDRYTDEEIDTKLGHLIDTEKFKDIRDPKKKKAAMKSEFTTILGKVPKDKQYESNMRDKMLSIIDDYWISQMEYLDIMQKGSVYQAFAERDPIKAYQEDATLQFRDMIDCVRNEIATYALNPKLKYGEYKVPEIEVQPETSIEDIEDERGVIR